MFELTFLRLSPPSDASESDWTRKSITSLKSLSIKSWPSWKTNDITPLPNITDYQNVERTDDLGIDEQIEKPLSTAEHFSVGGYRMELEIVPDVDVKPREL